MDEHALECLRKAGAISREARELGVGLVDEGKRLVDVENEVEAFIVHRGARPAFPVNIGVNDIAAHFSPSSDDKTIFHRGDLVKVDVGAHVDGYVGDTAATVEISTKNWRPLIDSTSKALRIAIEMIGENVSVSQIGGDRAVHQDRRFQTSGEPHRTWDETIQSSCWIDHPQCGRRQPRQGKDRHGHRH